MRAKNRNNRIHVRLDRGNTTMQNLMKNPDHSVFVIQTHSVYW